MATVSSSVCDNNTIMQAAHVGLNWAFASYNSAGNKTPFSGSVSDAICMLRLPRNSKIVAAYLGGVLADGNMGFSLGDPGSNTRHGNASISTTAHYMIPFQDTLIGFGYSVSDDQSTYPLTLNLQNVTSLSSSMSIHLSVLWVKR